MSNNLFACPHCRGMYFNVTEEGKLVCAAITKGVIGCGWKGFITGQCPQADNCEFKDKEEEEA